MTVTRTPARQPSSHQQAADPLRYMAWLKGRGLTTRTRIDYMPGQAALEALQAAQSLYPQSSNQALIDRLVITGLSALVHGRWEPPHLWGHRERWKLPDDLRQAIPANAD